MKLLTCEYQGRRFAAVSDGKLVYEAAPDAPAEAFFFSARFLLSAFGSPQAGHSSAQSGIYAPQDLQ